MFYKNCCGINLNLIRAALFIGTYDIVGTLTLIILNIEFFTPSERKRFNFMLYSRGTLNYEQTIINEIK